MVTLETGRSALEHGEWRAAGDAFAQVLVAGSSADAHDGLGTALWWLREPRQAVVERTHAYAMYRREGRLEDACRVGVWLVRELRNTFRRDALADGWLRRVRPLTGVVPGYAPWLLVAEAEAAATVPEALYLGHQAVATARRMGVVDAEIVAMADVGRWQVAAGEVEDGLSQLDEALTAATAGEANDRQCVAEAVCSLLEAAGWLGDLSLLEPWAGLLVPGAGLSGLGPLLPLDPDATVDLVSAFCGTCCGGIYLVTGRLDAAEGALLSAVEELHRTGAHPRCLHPVAALAELRFAQGRLEEAAALLDGYDDLAEVVLTQAELALGAGDPERAVATLDRAVDRWRDRPVRTVPWLSLLVRAALEAGATEVARRAATSLHETVAATGSVMHRAHADLADGRLALAAGHPAAPDLLRHASRGFAEAHAPVLAGEARLALASALRTAEPGAAVAEARSALAAFERLGAARHADRASAFLRECGVRGRTGPRDLGVLSRREQQVLRLVADGLSNAEIAERLFISPKTAGHHVSSILAKLDLRSRTEAAAFALLHAPLPRVPVPHRQVPDRALRAPE